LFADRDLMKADKDCGSVCHTYQIMAELIMKTTIEFTGRGFPDVHDLGELQDCTNITPENNDETSFARYGRCNSAFKLTS
jgi:hypothetical protein